MINLDLLGAKFDFRSEWMRRDINGKIDGEGIKMGDATTTTASVIAPFVIGKVISPVEAPQSLKTLGGLPEAELSIVMKGNSTKPSLIPDESRMPQGVPEKVPNKGSIDSIRGMNKQEETANLLAKKGYNVELQPKITAEDIVREPSLVSGKNPDFRVEGKIFDNLAIKENPLSNPKNLSMNTRTSIAKKIGGGQTTRIVLNLDESKLSLQDFKQVLLDNPIKELKEIIVVKKGEIIHFFPFN